MLKEELCEATACTLCASARHELLFHVPDRRFRVPGQFSVVRCTACGLVRLDRRLKGCYTHLAYPSDSYPAYQRRKDAPGLKTRLRSWVVQACFHTDYDREIFTSRLPGKGLRILDAGCAAGGALEDYRERGWETYGLEISGVAAQRAARGGHRVACGQVENACFTDRFFHLVRTRHVMEHLPNCLQGFRELRRVLRDDGLLVVEVPNFRSFWGRVFREFYWQVDAPRHIWFFSESSLRRILLASGLEPLEIRTGSTLYGVDESLRYLLRDLLPGLSKNSHAAAGINLLCKATRFASLPVNVLLDKLGLGENLIAFAAPTHANSTGSGLPLSQSLKEEGCLAGTPSMPGRLPKVAIVILNYSNAELTVSCAESFQSLAYDNAQIILVDNASPDGSGERVRTRLPQVRYLQAESNRGYSAGNNLGIRDALAAGADFILIVNNDTELIEPGCIRQMVSEMLADPTLGIVGPSVQLPDGGVQRTILRWPSLARLFRPLRRLPPEPQEDYNMPHLAEAVSGVCWLIRREVFGTVGLLDEDYFMYGEELDYCYRAMRGRWGVKYLPLPSVVHLDYATREKTRRKYIFSRRALVLFACKHLGRTKAMVLAAGLVVAGLYRALLAFLQPAKADEAGCPDFGLLRRLVLELAATVTHYAFRPVLPGEWSRGPKATL